MICSSVRRDVNHSKCGSAHLDSHANMIVCGKEVYIISKSGQVAEVNAFAKECGVLQIPIVDAAVVFEDPYNGEIYFLVMRNALYVESMDHHLTVLMVSKKKDGLIWRTETGATPLK